MGATMVLRHQPYAYWRLNDLPGAANVQDSSGNARHGTITGTPGFGDTSHTSIPVTEFNATTQHVLAPWATNATSVDNWVFEVWCRPTGTITIHSESGSGTAATTGTNRWVSYPENNGGTGYCNAGLSVGTNGVVAACHSSGVASVPATVSTTIPSDRLSLVTMRCVSRQFFLYLNGVLIRTGTTSNRATYMPTYVGCESTSLGGTALGGEIAEAAWFTGTPAASLILDRYRDGLTRPTWESWEKFGSNSPVVMG